MATSETPIKLESRVAILEEKVIQLQRQLEAVAPEAKPWWQYVVGASANDPAFEEAMRLGRVPGVAASQVDLKSTSASTNLSRKKELK